MQVIRSGYGLRDISKDIKNALSRWLKCLIIFCSKQNKFTKNVALIIHFIVILFFYTYLFRLKHDDKGKRLVFLVINETYHHLIQKCL